MESTESPSDGNSEKQHMFVEQLLSCSEESEQFESFVVPSSWDEIACGWSTTRPNVRYISLTEKKKKLKEKAPRVSPNFVDPESQYAKVKRLAGLITSSNAHCQQNGWPEKPNARFSLKKFRNLDVLSYETPCWRYIVNPRTFDYVDRASLQLIRSICGGQKNSTQTFVLENGGILNFQEVNGTLIFNDPAFAFDRHLLEMFEQKEEFRIRTSDFRNFLIEAAPIISQYRTEDNKIKVVHSLCGSSELSGCSAVCDMCRHRTQQITQVASSCKGECPRFISVSDSALELLKPLRKITPIQRKTAEESLIASKVLVAQAKNSKELKCDSLSVQKGLKRPKDKVRKARSEGSKLDWLPITKSGSTYSFVQQSTRAHGKFPDRPPVGYTKTFTLPHKSRRGKKLTLSEAASLVPKGNLGEALKTLSKELDKKVEKGVSLSDPLLPSVSGTKLEVPSWVCDAGVVRSIRIRQGTCPPNAIKGLSWR